jgi:hypothetical protein
MGRKTKDRSILVNASEERVKADKTKLGYEQHATITPRAEVVGSDQDPNIEGGGKEELLGHLTS